MAKGFVVSRLILKHFLWLPTETEWRKYKRWVGINSETKAWILCRCVNNIPTNTNAALFFENVTVMLYPNHEKLHLEDANSIDLYLCTLYCTVHTYYTCFDEWYMYHRYLIFSRYGIFSLIEGGFSGRSWRWKRLSLALVISCDSIPLMEFMS